MSRIAKIEAYFFIFFKISLIKKIYIYILMEILSMEFFENVLHNAVAMTVATMVTASNRSRLCKLFGDWP